MNRLASFAIVAVAFLAMSSTADARRILGLGTETGKNFAQKFASGNEFEIQSSQLALEKSQNADVKKFAQRMIDDHTQLSQKLKTAAETAKIAAPAVKLDANEQTMLNRLKSADARDFDTRYLRDQQQVHRDAVALLQRYSKHGDNAALKQFANEALPVVRQHVAMLNDITKQKSASANR